MVDMATTLEKILAAINSLVPISLIIVISVISSFLFERFWEYYTLKKKITLEQKKLWNEHVRENLKYLEQLEFDLLRLHFFLKSANDYSNLAEYLQRSNICYYRQFSSTPTEYLAHGHIVEYYEIVLPWFKDRIRRLSQSKPESSVQKDEVWLVFHNIVRKQLALINLMRIRLACAFFSIEALGHILIRSQLLEFMQKMYGSPLSPKQAKNIIRNEKKYEKINSSIHSDLKELKSGIL